MKKIAIAALLLLPPFTYAGADETTPYAMPRTQVVPITAGNSQKQYELYIKLPENYGETRDKQYPVIYTTDAVWHMDLLSGTTEYLMPDVILVGISWQQNTDDTVAHQSRFRDYTLYPSSEPERQAKNKYGQGEAHLSFIRQNVIPYVEGTYRTAEGQRAYLGYSLGGAFGAYMLFAAPDTFNHYILGSPALGRRSLKIIDEIATQKVSEKAKIDANVFVSIGELEEADSISTTKELVSILNRSGNNGIRLTGLEIIKASNHGTAVPETFTRSIKWLSELTNK